MLLISAAKNVSQKLTHPSWQVPESAERSQTTTEWTGPQKNKGLELFEMLVWSEFCSDAVLEVCCIGIILS
jgi:hypothetical protein